MIDVLEYGGEEQSRARLAGAQGEARKEKGLLEGRASQPFSRPMPLSLKPPHGQLGSLRWWQFTQKTPARVSRATRCARATFMVQTAPPRPYLESLA